MNNALRIAAMIALLAASLWDAYGQSPTLNEILDNAATQSRAYVETFKNLAADETKTFVLYKKNGDEKKRRTIISNFLVLPLTKEPDRVVEFRNVISVDGKPVKNGDKRAQDLFDKVSSAETPDSEIKKLVNESLRYDEQILISGLTLFQTVALEPRVRHSFQFELQHMRSVNGRSAYVVLYKQIRETPDILVNSSADKTVGRSTHVYDIETDKKVALNARLNGTLTIDAKTFRILGETRRLTIQPVEFSEPLTVIEDRFEFQESAFDIYTPKAITHTQYRARIKERETVKEAEISFTYGNFSRPDVEVESGEVKP